MTNLLKIFGIKKRIDSDCPSMVVQEKNIAENFVYSNFNTNDNYC